jgi:hypothetical protein
MSLPMDLELGPSPQGSLCLTVCGQGLPGVVYVREIWRLDNSSVFMMPGFETGHVGSNAR